MLSLLRFVSRFICCSRFAIVLAFAGVTAASAQSLTPAPVTIVQDSGGTAPGYIFYTQQRGQAAGNGPVIMDTEGRAVWYLPLTAGVAADLRVQTYHGQTVLTWAQGLSFQNATPNTGVDYIYDASYNKIAEVRAGNGLNSDLHEFELTAEGTALITIYHLVPCDLSAFGGSANGLVLEGALQEIDVATGAVLLEWHSLDHVGFDESYVAAPANGAYDYFHINSVKVDADGNLIVSARHTSTVYKINRKTGAVMWRLGGKKSDFTFAPGLAFAFQHNAVPVDATMIRIFDNGTAAPSKVLWVKRDETTMTAMLAHSLQHPANIFAFAEGGAETLSNGDTFVGWGTGAAMSEFDAAGNLIYDVRFPRGYATYRAVRQAWVGKPATNPTVTAYQHEDGTLAVHAIWNGATEVANWRIIGTTTTAAAREVAVTPWNGLDTAVTLAEPLTAVQVVALDGNGVILGTSTTLAGPFPAPAPTITEQPDSVTIADGSAAVLSVSATDATSYQWSLNGTRLSDGSLGVASVSGATTPVLLMRNVSAATSGRYTCAINNATGSTTSTAAVVTVDDTTDIGRLINVSCRSYVAGGENALIAGFVVGGGANSDRQDVSIRASGPALTAFGVPDVLRDPRLDLYALTGESQPIATVLSRTVRAGVQSIFAADSTPPPALDPRDAMITQSLAPSAYTATVTSPSGDSGVALMEVDDAGTGDAGTKPRLINGSGRAWVGTGANVLVAGFVIGGSTSRTVLIRASGPALAGYGVSAALADPQLQLYAANGELITGNNDWAGNPQIASTAQGAGAFPWRDPASKDAALLITLPPGAYTAQVSGADGGTGVALVEVYDAF